MVHGSDDLLLATRGARIDDLSTRDRWSVDARSVVGIPGGVVQQTAEMTHAAEALKALRDRGIAATFTHVLVRATALALARNPETYQMICGYDRLRPASIDVGVSTSDVPADLPAVVSGVERTPLAALVARVNDALADASLRGGTRVARGGWLGAIGFVRRWIVRRWRGAFGSRRRLAGTIEVSCDSNADVFAPIRFHTDALVAAGRIRDVVLVRDGVPVIRSMVHLCLSLDHVAMDGMRAAALINAVKEILEGDELLAEARESRQPTPAR
jgi:pyruvate/2-oxoglutarate dehydrogenase complex dihydrolipoamide acyltransferase (E2) component